MTTTTTTTAAPLSLLSLAPPTALSPADAAADLAHSRDLFRKLRFSYTEQVTKERLLKHLSADAAELAPLSPSSLGELEAGLARDKASLKSKKAAVAGQIGALDGKSRELVRVMIATEEAEGQMLALPGEIERLRAEVEGLRPKGDEGGPLVRLGLSATVAELEQRLEERERLAGEIERLQDALGRRKGDVGRLKEEVETLEGRKRGLVEDVRSLKRKGEEGGETDRRGRWARAQLAMLEGLVG